MAKVSRCHSQSASVRRVRYLKVISHVSHAGGARLREISCVSCVSHVSRSHTMSLVEFVKAEGKEERAPRAPVLCSFLPLTTGELAAALVRVTTNQQGEWMSTSSCVTSQAQLKSDRG
jgi:hypothetical protein